MKTLTIDDIQWKLFAEEEYADPVVELAGCMLSEEAQALVYEANNHNPWMWCSVRLQGSYRGILTADAYLGCCSYTSEEDFRSGGYYESMQEEVLDQLQGQLNTLLHE